MGDQITARKVQTKANNSYMPGNCTCGQCSVGSPVPDCYQSSGIEDWTAWWDKCCGGFCKSQRLCVKPDRNECEIGTDSKGNNPLISVGWNRSAPNLNCVYDTSMIDREAQIKSYEDIFGKSDELMNGYCGQPVPTCPEGMKSCSRYKSIGEGGDRCRSWYANLASDYVRDAMALNYCFRHDTEDCRCVNRTLADEYKALKPGNPINDSCWFVPCSNPGRFFVPSNLTKDRTCPENVCEIIFNIYKDRDVTIYDNDLVCNFGPPPDSKIIALLKIYWPLPLIVILLIISMFTD